MSAFLVRLNYGLNDLSFMCIGSQCSCGEFLQEKQVPAVFYALFESRGMDELTSEEMAALDAGDSYTFSSLTSSRTRRIRSMHVHQVRDQKKLGKKCRDESSLTSIFSVRPIKPGDFRLVMHGKKLRSFDMSLRVNNELKSLEGGINLALGHGDIIECFHRQIPCLQVMFLQPNGRCVQEDKTPSLLSLPRLMKTMILKCLNPVEAIRNLAPVCRSFFELVRKEDIWTDLELPRHVFSSAPLERLDDFFNFFAGNAQRLAMDFDRDRNTQQSYIMRPFIKSADCWRNLRALEIYSWDFEKHSLIECLKNEALSKLESLTIPYCGDKNFLRLAKNENLVLSYCEEVALSASYVDQDYSVDIKCIFPRLKRLHLSFIFDWNKPRDRALALPGVDSNAPTEFIHFLGSGVLRSFHAQHFPVEIDEEAWILANKLGTFSNLESLSLCEEMFEEMPVSYEPVPVVLFPELKSIWLQKTVPGRTVRRLMKMPLLERFCVMSSVPRNGYPERKVRRAPFEDYPTGWLENLKFVSDYDLLEAVIPYSKMINLECVALISLSCNEGITACDAHDGSSATCVLEELRWCSKLKGLVLRVPDHGIPNDAFKRMPQEWEFAAFSGLARGVVSTLKSFARNQNSLDDLWIHVSSSKDLKEILRALASFKLLKNVVLVLKQRDRVSCKQSMSACMRAMKMCWGMPSDDIDGSSSSRKTVSDAGGDFFVKQVTLLIVRSYGNGYKYHTYNFERGRFTTFLSSRITNFFSDWFKNVPCCRGTDESSVFSFVPALFPF